MGIFLKFFNRFSIPDAIKCHTCQHQPKWRTVEPDTRLGRCEKMDKMARENLLFESNGLVYFYNLCPAGIKKLVTFCFEYEPYSGPKE